MYREDNIMNMNTFNPEEYRNLSEEEKREFVREVVHSGEAAGVHAAFLNPLTGTSVAMDDIIEKFGEDKAIEFVMDALNNFEGKVKTIDANDLKNLMEKAERGECDETELKMLEYITNTMSFEDSFQFSNNFNSMMWDMIHFAQTDIGYDPGYQDVLSALTVSGLTSFTLASDSELSKYQGNNFDTLVEMMHQVSQDIYDTWTNSCTELPPKELIVMSLINLAGKISAEEGFIFAPASIMSQIMGFEFLSDKACECEECSGECSCHEDENTNGSNEESKICKPVAYNPSQNNEDMKDLLKD